MIEDIKWLGTYETEKSTQVRECIKKICEYIGWAITTNEYDNDVVEYNNQVIIVISNNNGLCIFTEKLQAFLNSDCYEDTFLIQETDSHVRVTSRRYTTNKVAFKRGEYCSKQKAIIIAIESIMRYDQ